MKPVIAHGQQSDKDKGYTVFQGERGPVVTGSHRDLLLTIFPRQLAGDKDVYEVHITTKTPDGRPDWSNDLNSTVLDLPRESLEEAADTYMRRLRNNISPQDIFRDQEEENFSAMLEMSRSLKKI